MNKQAQLKCYHFFLFLSLLFLPHSLESKMPTFFPAAEITSKSEPQNTSQQDSPYSSDKQISADSNDTDETETQAIPSYDPRMDNRLVAPSQNIGLFGKPIKEIEQHLKEYGAKNYSYIFGKCSRMTLFSYVITMYIDKNRLLAGVSISPKAPLKTIEPKAKAFFIELFLEDNNMSTFETIVASDLLEIKYSP